jgi:hypothetical protein
VTGGDLATYVVSGTERTGTSMMMHAMIKGGMKGRYHSGSMKKYDFNPNGLYEFAGKPLKNMELSEGKLIKVFGKKLVAVKHHFECGLKIVYMTRDPEESFISHRIIEGLNKSQINKMIRNNDVLSKYANEQQEIIKILSERNDTLSLNVFDFNCVIKNPVKHFTKLKNDGWEIDVGRSVETINPKYVHSEYYKKFLT